jgi:excisionase family DNA binding protein
MRTYPHIIYQLQSRGKRIMQSVLSDDYISVQEAADDLKVAKSTVRRWIASGDLPAYRVGKRKIALKRADVAALITPARGYTGKGGNMAQAERQPIRTLTGQEKVRARCCRSRQATASRTACSPRRQAILPFLGTAQRRT